MKRLYVLICALLLSATALAQWTSIGPFGGNARALAYDPFNPDHVILGSAGALFESIDGGKHWAHFAHLGGSESLMFEDIAFDPSQPKTIYVAGWNVDGSGRGGFFITRDAGKTWHEPDGMKDKSLQALAIAASDPHTIVVGALDGVYRSVDSGETWVRITPTEDRRLARFESVAVDPKNPKIIYAGTWHLPFKTTDGGETWARINHGLFDDSDVFSIILDRSNPNIVFASACSGIYKSDSAGAFFRRVSGIPVRSWRTRVLQQDTSNPRTVYAGTTAGLWKSNDAGKTFKRVSPANFIVNDVLVDPRNSKRVLIATDRGGVFASDDGGTTFYSSNDGFSQRQVTALVFTAGPDPDVYVAVANDKEFGGVFRRHAGVWMQVSGGLAGSDVLDLARAESGKIVAATNHGVFVLDEAQLHWNASEGSKTAGRIVALSLGSTRWFAATESGILVSDDEGKTWRGGPVDGTRGFTSVAVYGQQVVAGTDRDVWTSSDSGSHWTRRPFASTVGRVYGVTVSVDGTVWAATMGGALKLVPEAANWERVNGLPENVTSVKAKANALLVTVEGSDTPFVSRDAGLTWSKQLNVGFQLASGLLQDGHLYIISQHNGILLEQSSATAENGQATR